MHTTSDDIDQEADMSDVTVTQFVTADGVTQDPDGAEGTEFGGWFFRYGRLAEL